MKFLAPGPWPEITAVLKRAKSRRLVVSAFLGSGASKLLPLRRGDTLVVNASDVSLKTGATNPYEIAGFAQRGVRCYDVDGLHSKLAVADDYVIIGSANASKNSAGALIESCLSIRKRDIADEVEDWIKALPLHRIDSARLKTMKKLYKPPKWGGGAAASTRRPRSTSRAWITWLGRDLDEPTTPTYKKKMSDARGLQKSMDLEPWPISDGGRKSSRLFKNAKPGDRIIAIDHCDGDIDVYAPLRVLTKSWIEQIEGKPERMLLLEDEEAFPVDLPTFRKALSKLGVSIPLSGKSDREIKPEVLNGLRGLWA